MVVHSQQQKNGIPLSRIFPNYFIFIYHFDGKDTNQISANYQANGNFLRYENYSHFNDAESDRRLLPAKLVKQIDEKLDDGVYNSRKLRGSCYGATGGRGQNSYDNAIQNKKSCDAFNYKMP